MNIESMIESMFTLMPAEQLAQIKSAMTKVNEFLPLIEGYHATIPLKKDRNEIRVSYLLSIENDKIMLYQIVLAKNDNLKLPVISRTIGKWDILEKAKELTAKM